MDEGWVFWTYCLLVPAGPSAGILLPGQEQTQQLAIQMRLACLPVDVVPEQYAIEQGFFGQLKYVRLSTPSEERVRRQDPSFLETRSN